MIIFDRLRLQHVCSSCTFVCKLSSKSLPGIDDKPNNTFQFLSAASTVDPLALNNKVLSLELLLQIMECAGPVICNGEKFIQLVQSQLCVGRNGVSGDSLSPRPAYLLSTSQLEELCLYDNCIGATGVKSLVAALPTSQITQIDLWAGKTYYLSRVGNCNSV